MENTYIENGLLYFNNLKDSKLQIVTTFDNEIWGNMIPTFAKDNQEREEIERKDRRLADIIGYKTSFSLTTPYEDSMIDFDQRSVKYMKSVFSTEKDEYKNILLAVNSALVYPQEERYGYIIGPRDCAIVIITPKDYRFALIMHIGAPQLITGMHRKAMKMIDEFKELDMYITPYIHENNYSISIEKGEKFKSLYGKDIEKYMEKKFSDIWQTERYFFDFIEAFKDEMKNTYGITNIIDSGIDSYEETKKGHLYSYKYEQELKMRKERGEDISDEEIERYHKGFNVVVSI